MRCEENVVSREGADLGVPQIAQIIADTLKMNKLSAQISEISGIISD